MQTKFSKKTAFSAGLFILLGVSILVLGAIFLHILFINPAYTFNVLYKLPDHISKDSLVYYRGVEVGKVEDIELDRNGNATVIKIGISEHHLQLPRNVEIWIRLEGITGQRYIDIKPPKTVASTELIHNGDILVGSENTVMDKLQAQLNEIANTKLLEKVLEANQKAMLKLAGASKEVGEFAKEGQSSVKVATQQFNDLSKQTKQGLTETKCVAQKANHIMDQRFMGLKVLFGKPTQGVHCDPNPQH